MLERKDGRRHKHHHLLAVRHSFECSSDSNLGLSEAHVAADKSVHRTIVLHISLDSVHSLLLIRSVLVHK